MWFCASRFRRFACLGTVQRMSDSSPSDLAVAFRSFPRRLKEALDATRDDADAHAVAQRQAQVVERHLADAAAVLGLGGAGDAASVAAALADRIGSIHADRWDEGQLDALRRHALGIGAELRAMADLSR